MRVGSKLEGERRYIDAELILSSLVYACKKFRPYLFFCCLDMLHTFTSQLVNSTVLSRSMMKWLVESHEYNFCFLVKDTSGATLAYLLAYKEGPILVREVEEKTAKEEHAVISAAYTFSFDGSYKKTTHQAIGGFVIENSEGKEV